MILIVFFKLRFDF